MGLVAKPETGVLERFPEPVFDVLRTGSGFRHTGLEQLDLVLAGALGAVHGGVRGRHEGAGFAGVVGEDGDTDAHGGEHILAFDPNRGFESAQQIPSADLGLALIGESRDQDDELIPADAGDGFVVAQAAAEPLGDLFQEEIAGLVAPGVVDALEAIEVDEEHGHAGAGTVAVEDLPAEPLAKEEAVGEPG